MIKMMGICQSAIGDQLEAGSAVISILQRLIVPWWPAAQFKGDMGRGISNTILEMETFYEFQV